MTLDQVAREWLAARDCIRDALFDADVCNKELAERIAEVVIARLASHDPPILLEMQKEEAP